MICRLSAAVALLLASGCAGADDGFPSLAPRSIEKQGFAEPSPVPSVVVTDPALDRQIADLTIRFRQASEGFAVAAGTAERKAGSARGRSAGSEPWLEAQTALAELDDWRAQASALATDVEQAAIARAAALSPPYPALSELGQRVDAEGRRQGDTIDRIQKMLAQA